MRTKLAILILLALVGLPSGAANAEAPHGLFRIKALNCQTGAAERWLTGFVLRGPAGIVTALHGVVGCRSVTAQQAAGSRLTFRNLSVIAADVDRDVAILGGATDIERALFFAIDGGGEKQPRVDLKVWGYPHDVGDALESSVRIRADAYTNWAAMAADAREAMKQRQSPRWDVRMLSIEGFVSNGHSGAPIINDRGQVIGIVNGGLAGGTIGISLAAPIWDLQPKHK